MFRHALVLAMFVITVLVMPTAASAHFTTSSVSDVRVDGERVTWRLYLDPYHLDTQTPLDFDGDGTITAAEVVEADGLIRGLIAETVSITADGQQIAPTVQAITRRTDVDMATELAAPLTGIDFPEGFDWVVVDMGFTAERRIEDFQLHYGIAFLSDNPDEHTGFAMISQGSQVARRLLTAETAVISSGTLGFDATAATVPGAQGAPWEILVLLAAAIATGAGRDVLIRGGRRARAAIAGVATAGVARPSIPRGRLIPVTLVAIGMIGAVLPAGAQSDLTGLDDLELRSTGTPALAPEAGVTTDEPGYTYNAAHTADVVSPEPYFFARNDVMQANILARPAPITGPAGSTANNQPGSFRPGAPVDIVLNDQLVETLDWTELVLKAGGPADNPDWYHGEDILALPTIVAEGDAISASGFAPNNPNILTTVTYRMLPGVGVMKMTAEFTNVGATDFAGSFEYLIDNDAVGGQGAFVPGLGVGPGYRTSGWGANYLYNGPLGANDSIPAHGIAWLLDAPVAIEAPGYVMGAWFDVSAPAGGSDTVELYHVVSSAADGADPSANMAAVVGQLLEVDPALADFNILSGTVKSTEDLSGVNGAAVIARNIDAEEVARAVTGPDGSYEMYLPNGTYTLTVKRQGFDDVSGSVEVDNSQFGREYQLDFEMAPVRANVAVNRPLTSGQAPAEAGETGITLENRNLSMAIADGVEDGQLEGTGRGKPLDLSAVGNGDGIDWINLPYLSADKPSGDEPWRQNNVLTDTVTIVDDADPDLAQVIATGESTAFDGVDVQTTYTARTVGNYIEATTVFTNTTGADVNGWIGDALDVEGGRQASYSPGNGGNTGPTVVDVVADEPWMAMFNASPISYGVVYGRDDLEVRTIGSSAFIVSAMQVTIPAGGTLELPRRIVAAPYDSEEAPWDVISDAYDTYRADLTGLTVTTQLGDGGVAQVGDTVILDVQVRNGADTDRVVTIDLDLPPTLEGPTTTGTLSVPAGATTATSFTLQAVEGGNRDVVVTVDADDTSPLTALARLNVDGPGWFDGDNHSHSLYSDGSGTIPQNFAAARSTGLNWLTATDHNTVAQRDDVARENREGFVALFGDEETCSYGHSLAYAIESHTPCGTNSQQMLDGVLAQGGFLYIAHPYYPGLFWSDFDATQGLTGIEVWNGFYPPRHPVNAQAFAIWDQLNGEGRRLLGLANSDAHNPSKVGAPRIRASLDAITADHIIDAMRTTGAYYGTDGPDIRLTASSVSAQGSKTVGMGEDLSAGQLTLDIRAFADAEVSLLRVIKNGAVLEDLPLDGTDDVTGQLTDTAVAGDVYRVEVETTSGRFAFTNPVFITS